MFDWVRKISCEQLCRALVNLCLHFCAGENEKDTAPYPEKTCSNFCLEVVAFSHMNRALQCHIAEGKTKSFHLPWMKEFSLSMTPRFCSALETRKDPVTTGCLELLLLLHTPNVLFLLSLCCFDCSSPYSLITCSIFPCVLLLCPVLPSTILYYSVGHLYMEKNKQTCLCLKKKIIK